jgi:hypothetical protein
MSTQQELVAALLSRTGGAHDAYEKSQLGGVYDQHWPQWYAAYLLEHGLAQLLGASLAPERLSQLLKVYDEDYKREHPSTPWEQYYAARLSRDAR